MDLYKTYSKFSTPWYTDQPWVPGGPVHSTVYSVLPEIYLLLLCVVSWGTHLIIVLTHWDQEQI